MLRALPLALIPFLTAAPNNEKSGCLTVKIDHLRDSKGCARIALWNRPSGFPTDPSKVVAAGVGAIHDGAAIVTFENIPPGAYAVSAFHDENDNGKLDSNFLHIPTEGFGFSNNAQSRMGPPSFNAAKFAFQGGTQTIDIEIRYLF